MVNPFHEPKNLDILKEAFPLIDVSVIDDTLRSAKGDVNQAFEMLLAISDPSQSASNGPPLPNRPTINSYTEFSNSPGVPRRTTAITNPLSNPFIANTINAKPLTVREELAQWRQDLREESRQRATNSTRNSSASTPNLSLSNMFKSNSSRSSLNDRSHGHSNHRENHSHHASSVGSPSNYQRPLMPISKTTGVVHNMQYSTNTPYINYQTHSRSNSNPVTQPFPSTSFRPQLPSHCTPPTLPNRPQSSNSLNLSSSSGTSSNSRSTNPFLTTPSNNLRNRRSVPNMPSPNVNPRESSENDTTPSFNPFEEAEVPPPAYHEIHRDSVVNLAP